MHQVPDGVPPLFPGFLDLGRLGCLDRAGGEVVLAGGDLDCEDLLPDFLAGAFPHERPWNEPGDGSPQAEDDYGDPSQIRGSLNLSHQGCGYMVRLVLNGPQRGTLWEDGRCSDMGITPFRTDFATWYLQWLRDPKL